MRLLALLLLLFAEGAVLACSCLRPEELSVKQRSEVALNSAIGASLIAEVEFVSQDDHARPRYQVLRPLRTFLGMADPLLKLKRVAGQYPDGSIIIQSCEYALAPGRRALVVLYPADDDRERIRAIARRAARGTTAGRRGQCARSTPAGRSCTRRAYATRGSSEAGATSR